MVRSKKLNLVLRTVLRQGFFGEYNYMVIKQRSGSGEEIQNQSSSIGFSGFRLSKRTRACSANSSPPPLLPAPRKHARVRMGKVLGFLSVKKLRVRITFSYLY